MRVLIDMDGVIADFEAGFIRAWTRRYPDRAFVPLEQRTTFKITDQYPAAYHQSIRAVYAAPGFFRGLDPIAGSLDALRGMAAMDIQVFICSSPITEYRNCVAEKYEWVEHFLGADWINRIILTKDKTLVQADLLIDDNPRVGGLETPGWEHVLYDAPYNRTQNGKRRITWENWKTTMLGNRFV